MDIVDGFYENLVDPDSTIKQFINNAKDDFGLNQLLCINIIKRIGASTFKSKSTEVYRNGIGNGLHGFDDIRTNAVFYIENKDDILQVANKYSNGQKESLAKCISEFTYMDRNGITLAMVEAFLAKDSFDSDIDNQIAHGLTLFAVEECAWCYKRSKLLAEAC